MKLRIILDASTFETELSGPVELGRQFDDETNWPPPSDRSEKLGKEGEPRVLFGWSPDHGRCSRRHVRLDPIDGRKVRVYNLSTNFDLPLPGGAPLPPRESEEKPAPYRDLTPPFRVRLDGRTVAVRGYGDQDWLRLSEQTLIPGTDLTMVPEPGVFPPLSVPQTEDLMKWLRSTVGVLQAVIGSADFLQLAAKGLVQIVGLNTGRVLLRQGDEWKVEANDRGSGADTADWEPSDRILELVLKEKRTICQTLAAPQVPSESLAGLSLVVAAPLLNAVGEIIGALYGELFQSSGVDHEIGKVEALLVELLAVGVSAGLAQERQAALFKQFFTTKLATELQKQPDLLNGRTETVTVLFCDVRGFSRMSEAMSPKKTLDWMSDVLGTLSDCVIQKDGVLVDYVGDELLAMWGAPQPQPDQTERAVQAALAMIRAREDLNRRWSSQLPGEIDFGIGIGRGEAQVGNIGWRFKYKYGPLGNSVNLASRVQGLTMQLGCPLLVTQNTLDRSGKGIISRRVVKVRVVNITEPVDLYQLEAAGSDERRKFFQDSEQALQALENRDFEQAAHEAARLLVKGTKDGPLLLTLARAADALRGAEFDPVWEAPCK